MDCPESYYYKTNILLLSLVGVSPYQKRHVRLIIVILIIILLAITTIFQVTTFITKGFEIHVIVSVTPTAMTSFLCLVYTPISQNYVKTSGKLLASIRDVWQRITVPEEREILHKYAELSRQVTKYFSMYMYSGIFVMGLSGMVPQMLDVIIPLNESRPREFPIQVEIFVDSEDFFYNILFFICLVVALILTIITANQCLISAFIIHVCGVTEVICHRLETIAMVDGPPDTAEAIKQQKIVDSCIKEHGEILKFAASVEAFSTLSGLLLLIGIIVTLTMTLVEITTVELMQSKTIPFAAGQLITFFFACFIGQKMIDATLQLFTKAYSGQWQNCTVDVQKALTVISLRAMKPCTFSVKSLFIFCIESFGLIAQTSISYCMVLRKMQ